MPTKITRQTIAKIRYTKDLPATEREMVIAHLYRAAWLLVEPEGDWKEAVDAEVDLSMVDFDEHVIRDAINFMTATPAQSDPVNTRPGEHWKRFRAVGYRMGPAGP